MEQIILFVFLALFPLGQIIRIGILQPIDVIAAVGAIYAIVRRYPKPKYFKYFEIFLLIATFSWVFSLALFKNVEILYGFLYLVRLFAYLYFSVFVWGFAKKGSKNINLLFNSLISLSFFSAVFGWIQYFLIPDTRALYYLGWDDHYLRIIGTFLDPTYLGLIIVFGALAVIYRFLLSGNIKFAIGSVFLVLTLAFTYSRASYLAFFAGLFVILWQYKKLKYFLVSIAVFLGIMFLLPTSKNTILSFTRVYSAVDRIENYKETIQIFKDYPLFGVGYDNLCFARKSAGFPSNYLSHSCSGSDSSLLFVLATTGIIGFMSFIYLILKTGEIFAFGKNHTILKSIGVGLLVHSLFSNSMFYPWVMGYMAILLAVSLRYEV